MGDGLSERYGPCDWCKGKGKIRNDVECGLCGGTGFSGNSLLYDQKNMKHEPESNQPKIYDKKKISGDV